MPTFAELRAKAEAAASSARESANSRIADYRGDKKPDPKPAYKPPPPRPAVKPPLPPQTSRPGAHVPHGYEVEESGEEEREVEESVKGSGGRAVNAALGNVIVQRVEGIDVLLRNKELFFQFMDQASIDPLGLYSI
jgi:hypothetical protein